MLLACIPEFLHFLMLPMRLLMSYAYESNYLMALFSCVMALVFMVHLKSGSILLENIYATKSNHLIASQPSPINIVSRLTVTQTLRSQLQWHCYDELPPAILLENNGSTVIMRISCAPDCTPYIRGGALPGKYYFVEAAFKWRHSEHLIDSRKYALELQVLHATNQSNLPFEYLTVSYLFTISRQNNEHMDHIVENLHSIVASGSVIELPPFDLVSMIWPFTNNYYSYSGTYSNGNTVLPTQWLICTRLFHICRQQLEQFGVLCAPNGDRIAQNARTPQPLGNRCVQLNC